MMTELFSLNRNNAVETFKVAPWDFMIKDELPDNIRGEANKNARTAWACNRDTDHCFFSGFEGEIPGLRVSNDNPPIKMHAFVADFDRPEMKMEDVLEQIKTFKNLPYSPNYVSSTLSGGARLVWVLAEPLNMGSVAMAKKYLNHLFKVLYINKLLPGPDVNAIKSPTTYYEVGEDWTQISTTPIPTEQSLTWMMKSLSKEHLATELEEDVPFSRVQIALEEKYPEVVFPVLAPGVRMARFWDTGADNDTAAYFMPGGIFCHTGDEGFKSWGDKDLLGRDFMKEFEVQQTGAIIKEFWYDGKQYISRNPRMNGWIQETEKNTILNIAVRYGLMRTPAKKGLPSPIENLLFEVQVENRVQAATEFIHMPEGELTFAGQKYINTSQVKAMKPSGRHGEWGEHFPFLAKFMDGLLVDKFQLDLLLGWWKRFYEGALAETPERGQIMIVAGPPACGKTLFSTKVLGPSVGGSVQTADFYVNGGTFADTYYTKGLHIVDDAEPGNRIDSQKSMAARLKKTAASDTFSVNGKNRDIKDIMWLGRVCMTTNDEPEAMKAMPALMDTLEDKMILLRAREPRGLLNNLDKKADVLCTEELPHLLQWLVDWTPPKEVIGTERFGVKSFSDPVLKSHMDDGDSKSLFLQDMITFLTEVQQETPEAKGILWPSATLFNRMADCELIKHSMRGTKKSQLPHALREFENRKLGVMKVRRKSGNYWAIKFDIMDEWRENEELPGEGR